MIFLRSKENIFGCWICCFMNYKILVKRAGGLKKTNLISSGYCHINLVSIKNILGTLI